MPQDSELPHAPAGEGDWVTVPREPTHEMTTFGPINAEDAFNEYHKTILRACGCGKCDEDSHAAFGAIYRAMIASAPQPHGGGSNSGAVTITQAMLEAGSRASKNVSRDEQGRRTTQYLSFTLVRKILEAALSPQAPSPPQPEKEGG